jgi:hypothetical protein
MVWDGGELSGAQHGCVFGMDENVGVCIEGVRSRFKPWGGVGGVSVGGATDRVGMEVGMIFLRMS